MSSRALRVELVAWITGLGIAAISVIGTVPVNGPYEGVLPSVIALVAGTFPTTTIDMAAGIVLGILASQGNFFNAEAELWQAEEHEEESRFLEQGPRPTYALISAISATLLIVYGVLAAATGLMASPTAALFILGGTIMLGLTLLAARIRELDLHTVLPGVGYWDT